MIVNSHNDWDPLEEIIVGRADHSRIATDISARSFSYANFNKEDVEKLEGPYPQWVIDEANEDADGLADALKKMDIKVHRPKVIDWEQKNYDIGQGWQSKGWYSWCPRDLILPLGDMLIETPTPVRARYFETKLYEDIMYEAFEDGALWLQAPKPNLHDSLYTFEDIENKPTLLDHEIIFDAPNIVRVGTDLLYQVSNSGNMKGYKWLKRLLEPMGYKLHYSELYSFAHFDSTIVPLRPGLVLMNSSRVTPDNCPEMFKSWDKIWFDDCVVQGSKLAEQGYMPPCSPYIGMNLLSVDENTVVLDSAQEPLMRELDKHGIDSVPVQFRHSMTLSGGIHCATLDLRRKGGLETYCD
jgi:scyllo-inosamine-4-phosphate amidinotransferase 1